MRTQLVLLAVVVGLVSAQNGQAGANVPLTPEAAAAQIAQEHAVSSAYLNAILALQHATHSSNAATSFSQEVAAPGSSSKVSPAQSRLVGSYHLLQATIIKSYQIIFSADQVQNEFYFDRLTQLPIQSAGQQVPPQLLQLFYLKSYTTILKTLKLSYALQVVSHFRTWLEDEIDVGTAVVGKVKNYAVVAQDQSDDLVEDKLYAFNAYHTSAQLDFQLAYLEMYLQQAFQALIAPAAQAAPAAPAAPAAAPAAENAASFLEEEESAQSEFLPFMGAQNPTAIFGFYKLWRVMYEYSAARAGLSAALAEKQAYTTLTDDDSSNDDEGIKAQEYAQQLFAVGYAQNLLQSSQIEYILAIYQLYSLYAPAAGAGAGAFFL